MAAIGGLALGDAMNSAGRPSAARGHSAFAGEAALRMAYRAHGPELYRLALRSLGDRGRAEEVTQDTFVRAWSGRERFDPTKGSLRTWLFAIARNLIVDEVRRSRARPQLAEAAPDVADPGVDPVVLLEDQLAMEDSLSRLSAAHREVIEAVHYQGHTPTEVAAALGIPAGTVRSRLYYALSELRDTLEQRGWNPA